MSEQAQHVVIVGAGQAGGRATEALRLGGYRGALTMIGSEPHLPYERPALSKAYLHAPSADKIVWVRPLAWYEEQDVRLRIGGRAVEIDRAARALTLADGSRLSYSHLVLATGTRPSALLVPGGDHEAVHYLRTLDDASRLQAKLVAGGTLVVVGAGLIGLEVAAAARRIGADVVVLEANDLPMSRAVPAEVGAFFAVVHRRRGVDLRFGARVQRIDHRSDGKAEVGLADGSFVAADLVLVGIGVVPNVELAEAAGLAVRDGIEVDGFGRTGDDRIYAAGDVTSRFDPHAGRFVRLESWQNAQNQAINVAQNIMGSAIEYQDVPWFWSEQFDMNLQIAGHPDPTLGTARRGKLGDGPAAIFYLRKGRLAAVVGVDSPREVRAGRDLIAMNACIDAQVLADEGTDLIGLSRAMRKAGNES